MYTGTVRVCLSTPVHTLPLSGLARLNTPPPALLPALSSSSPSFLFLFSFSPLCVSPPLSFLSPLFFLTLHSFFFYFAFWTLSFHALALCLPDLPCLGLRPGLPCMRAVCIYALSLWPFLPALCFFGLYLWITRALLTKYNRHRLSITEID
ncbi:hypothetical protein NERG_02606 [Nematocida ausubeli]|uniref:Uncharacterized protein n=1 Tax=Nematocida ausubeli (strain ATCC PRA-371 / ERTm2) TaxID=1913371 RepID=H8ZG85_NEMA1|nr:hypothetical protein NERG_02606 [Nematocida ausubeli]